MLIEVRRIVREDESGQAIAVGALTMLVLAISVYTTVQLGQVIHQRIEVQSAADNAAYSVAAVVARSLNAVAWINRTLVTHYVAMMSIQSIASMLTGIHAFLGLAADLFQTIVSGLCIVKRSCQGCCIACGAIPLVGAGLASAACACADAVDGIQATLEPAAEKLRGLVDDVLGPAVERIDALLAPAVAAVSELNRVGMLGMQKAIRSMTEASLAAISGGDNFEKEIIRATAGEKANQTGTVATSYDRAMGLLNAELSYSRMFDTDGSERIGEGGGSDESDDAAGIKPAERLMAELANATRTGESGVTWESHRRIANDGAIGAVTPFLSYDFMGTTRLVAPMSKDRFREEKGDDQGSGAGTQAAECQAKAKKCQEEGVGCEAAQACASAPPEQTIGGDKGMRNYAFITGIPTSQWSRGQAMASAEYVRVSIKGIGFISGGGKAKIVGIQSSPKRESSFHCWYGKGQSDSGCGNGVARRKIAVPSCPWIAYTCPMVCKAEDHRHRFDGIVAYVSLEVEESPPFNQPDYWALVNVSPKDAAFSTRLPLGFGADPEPFHLTWAGQSADLEGVSKAGVDLGLLEGLNGWARAQVYYHRPGFWSEPPNLFNPFWRAKLAPISPKLAQVTGALKGLGSEAQALSEKALMH